MLTKLKLKVQVNHDFYAALDVHTLMSYHHLEHGQKLFVFYIYASALYSGIR